MKKRAFSLTPINEADNQLKILRNILTFNPTAPNPYETAAVIGLGITQMYLQQAMYYEGFKDEREVFYPAPKGVTRDVTLMAQYAEKAQRRILRREASGVDLRKKSRGDFNIRENVTVETKNQLNISYEFNVNRYIRVRPVFNTFRFNQFGIPEKRQSNYSTTVVGYRVYTKQEFKEVVPKAWVLMRTRYYEGRYNGKTRRTAHLAGQSIRDYYSLVSTGNPQNPRFIFSGFKDRKKNQQYLMYDNIEYLKSFTSLYGSRAANIFMDRTKKKVDFLFNFHFNRSKTG